MKRSILITGATGKLGKVFVKYFLEKGDEVIALAKTEKKLNLLKSEFNSYGENLKIINLDLMLEDFQKNLFEKLNSKNLKPTCLVNNARSLQNLKIENDGLVNDMSFINEYKLGVIAPYKIIMSLLKSKKRSLKKIVNISSIYGLVAPNKNLYENFDSESLIHYGVTKSALIQLTKDLAVRLSKKNIQVNCIAYGGVEGRVDEKFKKKYSMLCPSGKMLVENDLPAPLDLLLSEKSNGINGHVLVVDGGWTIW